MRVYAVNPLAVARYRDRHHVSGAKSDASDAKLLADLVRTDRHNHRPIAGDSPAVEAIKVLARAHQNLIWARTRHTNALRNALREYYPAALEAFEDLAHRAALGVLGPAPSPEQGTRLSLPAIHSALKRGGRQRNIDARAREIQPALRSEQLAAPAAVSAAFAATTRAAVGIIAELNRQIADLEAELATHFETHPDADIYRSPPGLGVMLGARVLGEFGDDPDRYTTAKSRKNYAGTSPRLLPESLSASDIDAFIATLVTHRDRATVLAMLLGGLRSAEVRRLLLADVDMGRRRLRVIGKGVKERHVPVDAAFFTELAAYLRWERQPVLARPQCFVVLRGPTTGARSARLGCAPCFAATASPLARPWCVRIDCATLTAPN
jgi:transposase